MKKRYLLVPSIILGITLAAYGSPTQGSAQGSLPACVPGNDWDQDGVANDDDVTADDSCNATSTGIEDCTTGAGDGQPDCDSTGL